MNPERAGEPAPRGRVARGGLAAFARASAGRLAGVQLVVALATAACVVWFVETAWAPVVVEAIRQLPPRAEIREGVLQWKGDNPATLAEGAFLSFAVDLGHGGKHRTPAQVQVEFGRSECLVISLLGERSVPYRRPDVVEFGRESLEPLWGAWHPLLVGGTALAVVFGLPLIWGAIASLYTLPVYLAGLFGHRDLPFSASWRLAGASLMPGAVFMDLAIVLYGLGFLDLVRLSLAVAVHFLIGWGFLAAGLLSTPRHSPTATASANPFRAAGGGPPAAS